MMSLLLKRIACFCDRVFTGAEQMVVTKSCSELLTKSFNGDNQFVYLLTYVLTAAAIGFAIFQIGYAVL